MRECSLQCVAANTAYSLYPGVKNTKFSLGNRKIIFYSITMFEFLIENKALGELLKQVLLFQKGDLRYSRLEPFLKEAQNHPLFFSKKHEKNYSTNSWLLFVLERNRGSDSVLGLESWESSRHKTSALQQLKNQPGRIEYIWTK